MSRYLVIVVLRNAESPTPQALYNRVARMLAPGPPRVNADRPPLGHAVELCSNCATPCSHAGYRGIIAVRTAVQTGPLRRDPQ
jgi:hypothetical protein